MGSAAEHAFPQIESDGSFRHQAELPARHEFKVKFPSWICQSDSEGKERKSVVVESKAPETLQEGFTRHFDEIRRFAYGRCGGSSVDDIASETFARAAAQWEQFDPRRGSLRAWLFGIATNVARESDRARRRQFLVSQRLAAQPAIEETPAAASEELDFVVSLLRRLPPKLRDVVLLVGVFDLSYEEAGRTLRIPVGTVASRLAAGRRRLASSSELRRRHDRSGRTSTEGD